jgi:hypothetical protein
MSARRLYIDGVALWSPALPSWEAAQAAFAGAAHDAAGPPALAAAPRRPAPALLAANERRRAPDTVLLALEVASRALEASGHAAADVASVFVSAHGDLPITDALCRTLAADPLLLSPTRFHHSVHNAASGYWAMGSSSMAASTALSAHEHSWAAGLLEASCQCSAEQQPMLLAAYDTEAVGPLASVNRSRGLLAVALVLAPQAGPASRWALTWSVEPGSVATPKLQSDAAQALATNAMADALPLMEALAAAQNHRLCWPLSATLALQIELQALPPAR